MDTIQIKAYIASNSDRADGMGILLSQIIASVYAGGHPVDLGRVHNFDEDGMRSLHQVLEYRKTPGWTDSKFYDLFKFANGVLDAQLVASATAKKRENKNYFPSQAELKAIDRQLIGQALAARLEASKPATDDAPAPQQ